MTTLQSREDALLRRVRAFDWARLNWCFAATALCMLLAHGFACGMCCARAPSDLGNRHSPRT